MRGKELLKKEREGLWAVRGQIIFDKKTEKLVGASEFHKYLKINWNCGIGITQTKSKINKNGFAVGLGDRRNGKFDFNSL